MATPRRSPTDLWTAIDMATEITDWPWHPQDGIDVQFILDDSVGPFSEEKYERRPITITMVKTEIDAASFLQKCRQEDSEAKGDKDHHGFKADPEKEMLGCMAEFATAKILKAFYVPSYGTYKSEADLGKDIEVRHSATGKLILRPRCRMPNGDVHKGDQEMRSRRFVLITNDREQFTAQGWIYGEEAFRVDYLEDFGKPDRPRCFAVPACHLRPINQLQLEIVLAAFDQLPADYQDAFMKRIDLRNTHPHFGV